MRFLIRWAAAAATLMGLAYYLPGVSVNSWYAAFVAALVIGLINAVIRPFITLLTLPVNILTLGLFSLVINALMLWLASSVVKGFDVAGFWPAFWASLILSLVGWVIGGLLKK